jgi:UDP-3-O-[3-hydroxymyristoyl] glucosamine N-acyltransferase
MSNPRLLQSQIIDVDCGSHVTIGKDCFIGHGVIFANDLFKDGKPNPSPDSWGRTIIGDAVTIGSITLMT